MEQVERRPSDSSDDDHDLIFQDLELFFHAIEEPQLAENFIKHRVTLGQLLEFDEEDLVKCGIDLVGDRKKILSNIGRMHCEQWKPSSLHDMTEKSILCSPGIYIALNDINKHLEYIGVTFKYLRRRIERKPEILELGKDYVGVSKIATELEDLFKTFRSTHVQLQQLNTSIRKIANDPHLKPANHIDQSYIRRARVRTKFVPILCTLIALCATLKLSTGLLRH